MRKPCAQVALAGLARKPRVRALRVFRVRRPHARSLCARAGRARAQARVARFALFVRIPRPEERVQNPPRGWLTIFEVSLRSGFRFPPCDEVIEILKFCGVSVSQFAPTGVARIMGLVAFFREHGSSLSLDQFRDWCDVRFDGGERVEVHSNKAWLEFEACKDRRHGNTLFGYVKNSWGLSEVWNALPDLCRRVKGRERDFSPVLGFFEPRELDNRLFNIYVYVEK
ncbi:hypothetical protein KSP39_PZI019489 [Platanthera zijinensis]|uniref:Uncharacterized protein n=1 Tax=Platanthera zijinensis TaxID=2320716 RepID=A0AAP0B2E9_9ASPA